MFFWIMMVSVFLLLSFLLVVNEGIVIGMIYMAMLLMFFGFMKGVVFISRWIKYLKTEFVEIKGEIVDTYVVTKPRYGSFGGARGSHMNVSVEAFNCLDILLSNGQKYKVFESFNENPYQHFDGKSKIGDHVKFTVQVYDDQHYMKEDFFRVYHRLGCQKSVSH
ncbi:hypothetical protein [Fusibacter sp. 3D3]|uniref:hypothetical protein n=1 Tax=Fusibacter sp. 3D3 TaxID=1048380 RepID=UPI001112D09D|nr:hypothetical protein [Fusibacter sp. 3D3]